MINNKLTFVLLRLAVGVSMFGHGLVRLPKLDKFSAWMMTSFEKSILPTAIVKPFSYVLPFAEFFTGLLLILGLFTRGALVAGCIVMIILIFGATTIESWDAIPTQLIHAAFFAVLLSHLQYNGWSLDARVKK
jgi:thiosulfate dehydrogenase (quinone) large subunit